MFPFWTGMVMLSYKVQVSMWNAGVKILLKGNSYIMHFQPPFSLKTFHKEICVNFISLPRKEEGKKRSLSLNL